MDLRQCRVLKQAYLDELHVYKNKIKELNKEMRIIDKIIKEEMEKNNER